jgi:hypothetical protein
MLAFPCVLSTLSHKRQFHPALVRSISHIVGSNVSRVLIFLCFLSSAALAGTVTITSPANGSAVNSPVHVHAAYNATATYMKLWVDHVASTVQQNTNVFDSFVTLSKGSHLIEVQAMDASTLQIVTTAANIKVATLAVNPPATSLPPGATQQFSESDSASSSVTWSATGGTISNTGLYTAGSATGTFAVTAKDSAGNTSTASMVIAPVHTVTIENPKNGSTVSSPVLVRATYANTVVASYMKVWVDHVAGLVIHNTNTFVTSLYLAPGPHLIEVQAKDATTGTVYTTPTNTTVSGASGGAVTVTPSSVTLKPGATQQFTASDSAGLPVTWSATGGTITTSGLYTAGATTGAFTVTATDSSSNKGTASVTIQNSTSGSLNYTTWKNDNLRTGQQLGETVLTPSNVNSTHFGIKFSESVDGYVFAQPLYLSKLSIAGGTHNVVFVATEHDSVYAFDADTGGAALWFKNLIPSGASTVSQAFVGSTIYPQIGITGTPVIDPSAGTIYLVTETLESSNVVFRLHALDVTNGNERPSSPVVISASGFQPKEQLQRAGLLLANGNVYIAFGSQGDNLPYHGWIFAYSAGSLAQIAVWNSTSTGSGAAIWMAGAGISADSSGNLYVMTGNGFSDTDYNGSTNWAQSFVKLSPTLTVLDHFTPYNWSALSKVDSDLGSGGVLLVPDQTGSFPHEIIGCGKPTTIWALNRDKMGGLESAANSGQAIQEVNGAVGGGAGTQSADHCFMTPAFWQQNLYFIGNNDVMKAFHLDPASGKMSTTPTSKSSFEFLFPGAQAVVSSNGATNGIVWAANYSTSSVFLHAYDATNLATELYRSVTLGAGAKWATPTVVNGKVYLGTAGKLYVFGSM